MHFDKINNKGQARLFQNQYLELLTKSHPLLIWGMYLPIIAYSFYLSIHSHGFSAASASGIFIIGFFSWTLFEYLMHRFAFHYTPKTERGKKIVYIFHGTHHHFPRDKQRLFMPPLPSIILASAIFGLCYLLMHNTAYAFFPGFLLGYLCYGSMHYAIHAGNPPFKWMKPLWRNHHLHHYKDEHRGFGVSSTFWDRIFGTMYDLEKEKEDKEKIRELTFDK